MVDILGIILYSPGIIMLYLSSFVNIIPQSILFSMIRESKMTKADLVEKIAAQVTLSKKDSEIVVNTVFRSIVDALANEDKVELRGFGSFRTRKRRSRVGRNPKTGDRVDVPEKKVPFFKPGKNLKKLVNE